MKLVETQVKIFRNIIDSTPVNISNDITDPKHFEILMKTTE